MELRFPHGQSVALVRVGEKGQIVIPKDMREMFTIQPGDRLMLMADVERGIALLPASALESTDEMFGQRGERKE